MPSQSPFQIDIPATDLLTYLFPEEKTVSDKPIWIDADDTRNSLSPRQLLQWVKRLGFGLRDLGMKNQDVVMVYSANHIFVPVAYLGISGCGCIFSGCNPAYGVEGMFWYFCLDTVADLGAEVVYQITNTECKIILVEPPLLRTLLEAAKKAGFPTNRIFAFSDKETGTLDAVKDWRSFLPSASQSESWKWSEMNANESRTTIAALNYSSGTVSSSFKLKYHFADSSPDRSPQRRYDKPPKRSRQLRAKHLHARPRAALHAFIPPRRALARLPPPVPRLRSTLEHRRRRANPLPLLLHARLQLRKVPPKHPTPPRDAHPNRTPGSRHARQAPRDEKLRPLVSIQHPLRRGALVERAAERRLGEAAA